MTHDGSSELRGPHPDPPVDDNLDIAQAEIDPGVRPATEHSDPAAEDDEVDEASMESFPNSDPPATWAGPDDV